MHYCTHSLPVLVIVSSRDRQRVTLAARIIRSQNCPPLLPLALRTFSPLFRVFRNLSIPTFQPGRPTRAMQSQMDSTFHCVTSSVFIAGD